MNVPSQITKQKTLCCYKYPQDPLRNGRQNDCYQQILRPSQNKFPWKPLISSATETKGLNQRQRRAPKLQKPNETQKKEKDTQIVAGTIASVECRPVNDHK
ncbi:hypothetical protein TNCT_193911 [Trichonephila clavata]|uniref:Uncharacterized protein n=1 Tax=Trichonephila clavata TaxID=2740835 RepID=A0A8X6LZA3_TRICU|nr:hypothetical protein TNCT_193911 [Trichonephila clavata]